MNEYKSTEGIDTNKDLLRGPEKMTLGGVEGSVTDTEAKAVERWSVFHVVSSLPLSAFYVVAFPFISLATVMKVAWIKRREKQMHLERSHTKAVAVFLSFMIGLIYVIGFPLIVLAALIKKLVLSSRSRSAPHSERRTLHHNSWNRWRYG